MWFQNRRMKHKRQTLSKEDGDEKDGGSSDGGGKSKNDKMMSIDEDEKKSCHNCDISGVGDVGSSLGEANELGSGRAGTNNNTPSATNNNNNSNAVFSTNSNGASSVGSTNSVSSSFEKMITEEDSRSQDGSEVTSPSINCKKLGMTNEIRVKVEGHKSPNAKHHISISKKSPPSSTKEQLCSVTSNGVLLAMPDSTVSTPALGGQASSRSLTPSSTPGTPVSIQLQQGSPVGLQTPHGGYMQRPRSSPSSTSSIPVTIQATMIHSVTNPTTISTHVRSIPANAQGHFAQQQQNLYQSSLGTTLDYRNGVPMNHIRQSVPTVNQQNQSQNAYISRDVAYQQRVSYSSDMHSMYNRQGASRVANHGRTTGTTARPAYSASAAMQFHQQQSQYSNTTADYNGYGSQGAPGAGYHAGYHSRNVQVGRETYNSYSAGGSQQHQQQQSYGSNPQADVGTESYMSGSSYGYPASGTYHATAENLGSNHGHAAVTLQPAQQHYYNEIQQQPTQQQHQHHHGAEGYIAHQTPIHSSSGDYRTTGKCHTSAYYEQTAQLHIHQGGEASSIPTSYVSSPDTFPTPGMTGTATAIAAATAAVITPPDSTGQAETNNEAYNNFGSYYGSHQVNNSATVQPPASADNSNSSSDFNFLSNLAHDLVPEYYQLS